MSNYKIIMTGGGTAGHVTPNLALVPKLKEKGFDIKYIGSYEGIEKEIIVDAGIPYFAISSGKLRRYFDMKNFTDPFKVIKGIAQANKILAKEKPDVIILCGEAIDRKKISLEIKAKNFINKKIDYKDEVNLNQKLIIEHYLFKKEINYL